MPPLPPISSSRIRGFICKSCLLKLQRPQPSQPPWLARNATTGAGPKRSKILKSHRSTSAGPEPVIKHFQLTPDGQKKELPDGIPTDDDMKDLVGKIIHGLDEDIKEATEGLGISKEELEKRLRITQDDLEKKFGVKVGHNPWEKQDGPDEEEMPEPVLAEPITDADYQEELEARDRAAEEPKLPSEIFDEHEMSEEEFNERMSEDERIHEDGQERLVASMEAQMNRFPVEEDENISEERRLEIRRHLFRELEIENAEDTGMEYPDDEVVVEDFEEGQEREIGEEYEEPEERSEPDKAYSDMRLQRQSQPEIDIFQNLHRQLQTEQAELQSLVTQDQQQSSRRVTLAALQPVQPQSSNEIALSTATQRPKSEFTIPRTKFPRGYYKSVSGLNNAITRAAPLLAQNVMGDDIQRRAWRSYIECRKALLLTPDHVPLETWSLLWDIFERPGAVNTGRLEHVFRLGKDMYNAGIPLKPQQEVVFLEAMFMSGNQQSGMKAWQDAERTLGSNELTFRRYWKLGIAMYSQINEPEKALQTMSRFLTMSDSPDDFRLLIPIISAYLSPETPIGARRAWAVYEQLKYRLGESLNMQDYDAVTSLFLEANEPHYALRIFTEMMLRGKSSEHGNRNSSRQDLSDLVEIEKMEVSLDNSRALAVLPTEFNNKFFFGKWIKKLIGDGNLVGAKKVFDLMMDRGIRPDAKHMNGLIGAWYRTGSSKYQSLADETAWRMIAARLEFVRLRDSEDLLRNDQQNWRLSASPGKDDHRSILFVPHATIETFSILTEQYRRRRRLDLQERLFAALKLAKVKPTTHFMNEMILLHARLHESLAAWNDYSTFTDEHGVHPDFDTFTYLWHLEKKATDPTTRSAHEGFPSCQKLFSDMAKWSLFLNRGAVMPRELYDSIMLAFAISDNLPGTAVALLALHRRFGMYPNEQTARSIILQVAKVGIRNSVGLRPRRLNLNAETQTRIIEVTKVLATFKKHRVDMLRKEGIDFEMLGDAEKSEEALVLLLNLLRYVAAARVASTDSSYTICFRSSTAASINMGVPECNPWAPDKAVFQLSGRFVKSGRLKRRKHKNEKLRKRTDWFHKKWQCFKIKPKSRRFKIGKPRSGNRGKGGESTIVASEKRMDKPEARRLERRKPRSGNRGRSTQMAAE